MRSSKYNDSTLVDIIYRDNDLQEISRVVLGVFPDAKPIGDISKDTYVFPLCTGTLERYIYIAFYPRGLFEDAFIQIRWEPQHRPFSVINEPATVYRMNNDIATLPTLREALVYARLASNL